MVTCRRGPAIPLDLLLNVLLGFFFALCGRERIRVDGVFAPPAFTLVLCFAGVIVLPIALYLYLAHPAWSWMYTVDPDHVPGALLPPLLAVHGATLILGWWIGSRIVKAGKATAGLYVSLGGAVALLVAALLFWGRLGRYGSFEEWNDGRAVGLMDVKLGYVLLVIGLGMGAAIVLLVAQLLRDSRRATSK